YKFPSASTVAMRIGDRAWSFVKRAGTLIFAVAILVWAASYFPRRPEVAARVNAEYAPAEEQLDQQIAVAESEGAMYADWAASLAARKADLDVERQNKVAGAYMADSFLGRAGKLIEPAVRPLGWDWRIGCAAIASFPAREVVVGTLGVIYNLGDAEDEESEPLRVKLREATWHGTDRKVFNIPVALSIMVFFALCAQCAATLAVIRRETNSWGWPVFTFCYMTAVAYAAACIVYHMGMWLS
ncbi:MAG: ferrous iron transport protein B, partial [Planctomycetales bacterium]|nr:ferrous iron transport protein B [Planctomycetales bacterium]